MDPIKLDRFRGINNRLPEDRLNRAERGKAPQEDGVFVRDAVNVDLSGVGTFQRRPGFERVISAPNCRALFERSDGFFYAAGTDLMFFNGVSAKIGDLTSPSTDVAYVRTPQGTVWSDGFSLNLVVGTASRLLHPVVPNPAPNVSAMSGGSLRAGSYGVSFATVELDGRRSEMSFPQYVEVPDNGALVVSAANLPQGTAVFVTACDGTIFYREAYLAPNTTALTIPLLRSAGEAMNYEVMAALPPGLILAYHYGRLLTVRDNYLYYSHAFELGVHRPAYDYIPFDHPITVVVPVNAGVVVATTQDTFFLPGDDIAQATVTHRLPFGAVPGTVAHERNESGAIWFSPRGAVRVGNDGSIDLLQDQNMVFAPAQSGAAIVREENGLRSFIAALTTSGRAAGAVFGSYIDAETVN